MSHRNSTHADGISLHPRSDHLQYNDRLVDLARMIDELMRRRVGVAPTIHGLYAAPSIGGTDLLSMEPQVTRGPVGELYIRMSGPLGDESDENDPAAFGPWPVTQVALFQPHDVAVLVTPLDIFIMRASQLVKQLGEVERG